MKTKSVKILSAIAIALFVLGATVYGQGTDSRIGSIGGNQTIEAKGIAKPDAEKKYPPPSGGYPVGQRDPHEASGIVVSPYPPHQKYECKNIAHGGLVVDVKVNKVFARP